MITINLLPQELRKSTHNTPKVPYVSLIALVGVLFLLMTTFFYADYLKALTAYKRVQKEWDRINPILGQLKAQETKIEVEMKGEAEFLEKNILNKGFVTQILTWTSEYLPPKAWLTELMIEREGEGFRFTLKGAVFPTKAQTGIEQVEEYLQKIKTQLPSETVISFTTAKATSAAKIEETTFNANLEWGMPKKP